MRSLFVMVMNWIKRAVSFMFARKKDPETPDIDDPVIDPGEVVCYYGCPNSNKAKKLQLNKKTL